MISRTVAKISVICWAFVLAFTNALGIFEIIPFRAVWITSLIFGFILLSFLGFLLYQSYQKSKLDLRLFFLLRINFWHLSFFLTGFGLFTLGLFGVIMPQVANSMIARYGMEIAKIFVILFWTALTFTFLGLEIICLSESVGYWRLKNRSFTFGSFALGIFWLLLALLFFYLFLGVINDVFVTLNSTFQNCLLVIFVILSILIGLVNGKFEDLKILAKDED